VPTATPITASPAQLAEVTYNADGLVPAVVQEAGTGQVLMVAWMDRQALQLTLERGETYFWSRSRRALWHKGETSGNVQEVRAALRDPGAASAREVDGTTALQWAVRADELDIARLLLQNNQRGLPVLDDDERLVGVV